MTTTMSARATRFLMISAFGAAMPALLFSALQLMTVRDGAALPTFVAHKIDFKFVPPREEPIPPRPPKVEPQPLTELPRLPNPKGGGGGEGPVLAPTPGDGKGVPFTWVRPQRELQNLRAMDTDTTPIVRVLPDYPPNARGDGWVLVRFNISAAGTVTNAAVIDANPRGIFDKNALRAIERWRYRPAVVEGRAVERRGLQVRLVFELEQA